MKIRFILPKAAATLTGTVRYIPDWQPSGSWVCTAFRLYEQIFGRRHGIRAESTCTWYKDKNGTWNKVLRCYSLESVLANSETFIRECLQGLKPKINWVCVPLPQPAFAFAGAAFQQKPIFVIAVAYNSSAVNAVSYGTTTPYTFSYTATGSNVSGWIGSADGNGNTFTAMNYGAATGVYVQDVLDVPNGSARFVQYFIGACPTGSNTVSISRTSPGSGIYPTIATYSGCSASMDNSSQSSTSNATDNTNSITPNAAGAWHTSYCAREGVNLSAGSGSTQRAVASNGTGVGAYDSNGTISGATTFHITASAGTGWVGILTITLAPFVASSLVAPIVIMQAVKRACFF